MTDADIVFAAVDTQPSAAPDSVTALQPTAVSALSTPAMDHAMSPAPASPPPVVQTKEGKLVSEP